MNLTKNVEIEVTNEEILALTEQLSVDEMCDILLHFKRYRPHQSQMIFDRVVSDFKEESSGLALKFVRAEPEYTDGMGAMDVDKLIEDFGDYIDRNY